MLNRKKVKRRDTDKFLMTESEHLNAAMLEVTLNFSVTSVKKLLLKTV